jgi:uncharacterized protein (TIGR02996 family)
MSTARASEQFLAAIQAAPDDDGPRLVYADWLQKRGDVRGEFIAIQCTLAAMAEDPDDDARSDLQARQWQLFDAHAQEWLAELGLEGEEGVLRRGFVEEVNVSSSRLQAVHEQLGRLAVVRALWIFSRPDGSPLGNAYCRELFSWPWLSLLRELNLAENHLGPESIRMLAESPHLANLVKLDLEDNYVWNEGARALAASPYFEKLGSLNLKENQITDEGIEALAHAPWFANLRSLELAENLLGHGDAGTRALARGPHPSKLRELGLAKNRCRHLARFCRSPSLDSLSSLDLRDNPLDEESRAQLRRHFGKRVRL